MILILGATGLVGGAVLRQLSAAGIPVRALIRHAAQAAALAGPGIETVVGDLEQPSTLDTVLEGVTRALLLSPHHPQQVTLQGNFVAAAKRVGGVHVVKLSGLGTALDSPLQSGRWHAQTEQQISATGLPWTFLHPPFFMQNILRSAQTIASQGILTAAMPTGQVAMVDARDVAAVAVAALSSDGHTGQTYVITGPEALSFSQVAAILSRVTARQIAYQDIPLATLRQDMLNTGIPAWLADIRVEFATFLSAGAAATVTDTVTTITGQPPRTFEAFAQEHTARWQEA